MSEKNDFLFEDYHSFLKILPKNKTEDISKQNFLIYLIQASELIHKHAK
jgi:hypothetical protein